MTLLGNACDHLLCDWWKFKVRVMGKVLSHRESGPATQL